MSLRSFIIYKIKNKIQQDGLNNGYENSDVDEVLPPKPPSKLS